MWVSLYEPLVFFAGAIGRHFLFNRTALFASAVRGRWLVLAGIVVGALLIDGWRLSWPDATLSKYFASWGSTIQELHHLDLTTWRVWQWTGVFGLGAFVLLGLAARSDPRAWSLLMLVSVMFGLTLWQVRWGYFLALAVAFSIPWQLGALQSRKWGWLVGILALWPAAYESWARWHPTEQQVELRNWHNFGQGYWRRMAEFIRSPEKRPFLAPWWVSPQIAYWSRQPGVAGTSHQSLAGIVDTANFYLTKDSAEASEILRRRGVYYVMIDDVYDPETEEVLVITNSEKILAPDGVEAPEDPYGEMLGKTPKKAPVFLRYVTPRERGQIEEAILPPNPLVPQVQMKKELYRQQFLHLYTVIPEKLEKE